VTIGALSRLRQVAADAPARHLAWLPLQRAFLDDPSRRKLIRAGNQFFGKTAALCEEMRRRGEGDHPDPRMTYPRRMICISPSDPQSVNIQKKLWEALDKRLIDPRTQFDPVVGFRGRRPAVRWRNGSILLFKSGEAGAISFAGETVDDVFIDEPTTLRIYQEADSRVAMRGGYLILGMTPINARESLEWLRELVEAGVVSEHHARLEPSQMIPVGHDEPRQTADGTRIDADYIEARRKAVMGLDAPIILDGEWEVPPEGQSFPAFDWRANGDHVTSAWDPSLDVQLYVGIDHGEREYKQCAILVAVHGAGAYPQIQILDEYVGDGLTTHDQDARGIIAMLDRWGVRWNDLAGVTGDRDHDVSRKSVHSVARKSNNDIQREVSRELRIPFDKVRPPIRTAKRGHNTTGRLRFGYRWLHEQMLRPGHFKVQARCTHAIKSLREHAWKDDGTKDIIDALRYALEPVIMRVHSQYASTVLRVRS